VIYANTVSGAFQTASYTNLFQVWLSDTVSPCTSWVESFARASWMMTGVYPPTEGSNFLPFTAQRIENAKTARESINELGSLQDNWDGYGASSISDQARRHALLFIDMIEAAPSGVPIPEVSPQGCSTLFSCANGPGESEMPHTDGNRPVIADWWFPRRGAV
jgi:hypothetical protein